MTTTQIIPAAQVKVNFFVNAKFPSLNKNDNWEEYAEQMDETTSEKVLVQEMIILSNEDFQEFKNSLLSDQEWLNGKGGYDSSFEVNEDLEWFQLTEEQQTKWRAGAYRLTVMVQNQEGESILVDPQGYKYARYCGLTVK